MKSKIIIAAATLFTLMLSAPQVLALEIQVSNRGVVSFYEDSVLGRNTNTNKPTTTPRAIKTIPASTDKQVYIKPGVEKTTVELREIPNPNRKIKDRKNFVPTETIKTDRVEMNFPAQLTADDEDGQGYLKKIRAERKERVEEMVELKNQGENKQNALEIKSRNTTASLKNGAQFTLDPVTNEVMITAPSGNEHILNHLPDQAIARMEAAGHFFGISDDAVAELEVETNELGELIYTKKDKVNKKLFGIFPRQIDSEIILNDTTGEVTEVKLAGDSIFDQFFNTVSF